VLQIHFLADLTHGSTATAAMQSTAALHSAQIAFLGPLLGSVARPLGGMLADRIGGGRITFVTFVAMVAAAGLLVAASSGDGSLGPVVIGFIALFILSGVGNGSTYKMIPAIFAAHSRRIVDEGGSEAAAGAWSRRMSGALIGLAGAIGALGGVAINLVLRASYSSPSKSATMAFVVFLGFYMVCAALTWVVYLRRPRSGRVTSTQHSARCPVTAVANDG